LEKKPDPTLLIADSQAVKNTDSASNKGFCAYKLINGIKRHLVVDVLGIPLFVKCTSANKSDDKGLIEIIKDNQEVFLSLTYKITILVDNGYHKDKVEQELAKINPALNNKIEIKVTPKPTKNPDNKGFKPVYKRWVVERSNAWVEKCVSSQKPREETRF
jgi:Transposase DDE domain